jgi:spore coat protein CotF
MSRKSDLPFGSEFSPSQIDLARTLEIAHSHQGDYRAFEAAVKQEYFATHKADDHNKKKLASNTKLGMIAYGIINREATLTDFGKALYELRNNKRELYKALASHILKNLHGMSFISCIQDMMVAGEIINLTTLRDALAARGIHYPPGGKHPSMMKLWLEKAGIFTGSRWQINSTRLQEVLGIKPEEFEVLAGFSAEQRAFVRALANTGKTDRQPSNEIVKLATATYGIKFPEKSLPKLVLDDLVKAGYIDIIKTTSGRGAKPFLVAPTSKLIKEIVDPLLEQLVKQTDPKLRSLLKKPLNEILNEINSVNKHVAGLALEALAFKLMRLVDMQYLATRLRGTATGGAEVDIIFQSTRLVYSRWQVQCKNTTKVSLDDVAKEVGLTHFLKSNVIVIVSTGEIGSEATRYANKIMSESNLAIVMINGRDLQQINGNPSTIIDVFEREAHQAMKLKTLILDK